MKWSPIIVAWAVMALVSCDILFSDPEVHVPAVSTTQPGFITDSSAVTGGNVQQDGGAEVTARGVCWSLEPYPEVDDFTTSDGSGLGVFTSQVTGLAPETQYFVRAYATNSAGTGYGNEYYFFTPKAEGGGGDSGTFTDSRDQSEYAWVRIGTQVWMAENLAYMPHVGPSAEQAGIWVGTYNGTSVEEARANAYYDLYGCLYDFNTATGDGWGNGKDICPAGWHLPSDDEWKTLESFLGMGSADLNGEGTRLSGGVGKKIKSTAHWYDGRNGDGSTGFGAEPAGNRDRDGYFYTTGSYAFFWSSTANSVLDAWHRDIYYNNDGVGRYMMYRDNGYSVRCVRDE